MYPTNVNKEKAEAIQLILKQNSKLGAIKDKETRVSLIKGKIHNAGKIA